MELRVSQSVEGQNTKRILTLSGIKDRPDIHIFFELLDTIAPEPNLLDGFVFGIILYAMRVRENITVHGNMSLDGLCGINEFQEAWASWKPQTYQKIEITPSHVVSGTKPAGGAIAAFSGGADSIFTILRHSKTSAGKQSYPLDEAVLMVHGFDVPLNAPEQLKALQERTKPFIDALNLKLLTIRTNLKELNLQDWEDSFMSQLACCMHNYSHHFAYGMVGSSEPYKALVLPLGSSPATDHLLSSGAMRIIHDGAGFSRTEKVKKIASNKIASSVLKVCWEGSDTFRNCGKCEKCMRTKLNFLAVGEKNPQCFDEPLQISDIASIRLRTVAQCSELISILDYATEHHIKDEWVHALAARIYSHQHPPHKLVKLLTMLRKGEFSKIKDKAVRVWAAKVGG